MRRGLPLLLLLLFVSCSWFNNDAVQPLPVIPVFNTFTITGNLTTNGAMPENFAQSLNSRTAIATAPTGQTIQYKVLLLANSGDTTPITGASSESDGTSYTIKYTGTSTTAVAYWLRAVAYYMDGSNEIDILVSPDTQLETAVDLKGGVFTKDLEMRPATTGYGSASLTITLASATMCDSVTISDTTHFQVAKSGATVTITHKAAAVDNPKVACGSYPVTVNFYKTQSVNSVATDVLVYQFDDVINIFNNLTTTVWVDNGNSPHLTTESGVTSCSITTAKLADFNATNFYVNKNFTGTEKGTFAEPFKSLQYAIQYIEAVGNDTSTYTIHVKGVTDSVETFTASQNITKKITIEVYTPSSAPGSKNGYYGISYGATTASVFTVTNTGVLTFDSNGAAVGSYPVQGTKGITITSSYDGVSVLGKFIMKGGCIKGCSNIAVGIVNIGTVRIFEMTGGAISNNAGTGVYVPSNGKFMVSGKPYISGNTSTTNLKLDTGAVMTVTGPFVTGALIGVKTTTPPTAALPVQITTGYGYQTGGYNAGQLPGKYFRGDEYGVTDDSGLASPAGEAVLALSGGSLSIAPLYDPTVKFYVDKTFVTRGELGTDAAIFTFSATKVQEGTTVAIPQEDITYTSTLSTKGAVLANTSNYDYQSLDTGIKIKTGWNKMMPGPYEINITAVYGGNTYFASIPIRIFDVKLQEGYKVAPGATFNSSTTLCNGDADRKSKVFIANRNLTIPALVVSDHEVTQGEYKQYMTWYSVAEGYGSIKPTASQTADNKPANYLNWYEAVMYCNLKSKADKLTPAYYLADSTGAEVINGREVSTWMELPNSKIAQYENEEHQIVYYYNFNASQANSLLDYEGTGDSDGGIRFDQSADGWRLPTLAEWEYLARGGNLTDENQFIYSGSDDVDEVAVYNTSLAAVKSLAPNTLGLYDMSGNVYEWCWDWKISNITSSTPFIGPDSNSDKYRVTMGGSFYDTPSEYCRIQNLRSDYVFDRMQDQGFRIVRTIK